MEKNLTMALKGYVNTISGGKLHQGAMPITFSDQDLETVNLPHADPLIIKLWIGNAKVSGFWLMEEAVRIFS